MHKINVTHHAIPDEKFKNELVDFLDKLRFLHSQEHHTKIRRRAEECYHKLKPMFICAIETSVQQGLALDATSVADSKGSEAL